MYFLLLFYQFNFAYFIHKFLYSFFYHQLTLHTVLLQLFVFISLYSGLFCLFFFFKLLSFFAFYLPMFMSLLLFLTSTHSSFNDFFFSYWLTFFSCLCMMSSSDILALFLVSDHSWFTFTLRNSMKSCTHLLCSSYCHFISLSAQTSQKEQA